LIPEVERERGSSAGAWAAAALVLALVALVFAVLAHIRVSDLEDRVAVLESDNALRPSATLPSGVLDEPLGSTLPSGGESVAAAPPDPAQARADIVAAFAAVYDPNSGVDVRLRLIDDATGVAAAMRQAEAGPNAAALTSVTVNVNDVQYLSATRARVVYSLSVPGQPPVLGREGQARVASGAWKVTRATVCADLDAIGSACS
jgi:hypothetical protein